MTKNEINDCKKTINDFFGKNTFDNLLGIFGVTEQDLENVKEDETDKDISAQEIIDFFGTDIINNLFNIFDISDYENDKLESEESNKNVSKIINIENDEIDKKELPSKKLKDLNKKLDIHKIVQEYVTEENISNDDYAKLFEFACWLINK